MPAPNALDKPQKKIFRALADEIEFLDLKKNHEILAYEKAFQLSLPKSVKASGKEELIKCARAARVILVGDFHPFRQSQKGFVRLLADASSTRSIVGLECVSTDHQRALENFHAGRITVEELRDEIDFDHEWPFPWEGYREIFQYCRKNRIRLLGLNMGGKNADPAMIHARDELAANVIQAAVEKWPGHRIFALFGELHLGRSHLPASLGAIGLTPLVVHQNEISLYWRAPRNRSGQKVEVLKLRKNEFCVLNSVPWVKLKSYLDWLEGDESHWDENPDITETLQTFENLLAATLGLAAGGSTTLDVLGPEALPPPKKGLSAEEKELVRHAIDFSRTTYLPLRKSLLLPTLSTNALTEGAALWLWGSRISPRTAPSTGARLVAQFFIGYLGSKILNPKRKCNEVDDLKDFLSRRGSTKKKRVILRALSILRRYFPVGRYGSGPIRGAGEVEASRLAGYVIANRLFHALVKNPSLLPFVRNAFHTSTASNAWAEKLLLDAVRIISDKKIKPPRKNASF